MFATASLNVTSISVSDWTVAPAAGSVSTTVGATLSTRLYCHVASGALASNGLAGDSRSTMPWPEANSTRIAPSNGCGKLKVYSALKPVTPVAGTPLISRSDAVTPSTGSLKVTAICVKLFRVPGAGVRFASVGAVEGVTNIRTTAEVLKKP